MLEMVSGQYTFSIFLRQVLWKLDSLFVSCCVMRQHPDSDSEFSLLGVYCFSQSCFDVFFCTSLETDDAAQVSELVDVLESVIVDHDRLLCQVAVSGCCVRLLCQVAVTGCCVRLLCQVAVSGCCLLILLPC